MEKENEAYPRVPDSYARALGQSTTQDKSEKQKEMGRNGEP